MAKARRLDVSKNSATSDSARMPFTREDFVRDLKRVSRRDERTKIDASPEAALTAALRTRPKR